MSDVRQIIGIDIGGTKCAVCLGDSLGAVRDRIQFQTESGFDKNRQALLAAMQTLLDRSELSVRDFSAIGISCGGPLNSKTGVILSPPNLPGWDNIEIVKMAEEEWNIPAFLLNDANACALAEWKYGAGKGSLNMVFCTMGTGFGCGLILNGRLYEGSNENAGELGHVRLTQTGPVGYAKAGSVEGYCGGNGIRQLAKLRLGKDMSAKDIAIAARNGDAAAAAVYKEIGERLGQALSAVIDLLNPDCIVIGSIFERTEDLIRPPMEEILKKETLPAALSACRIVSSMLGDRIGDIAALSVAQNGLERLV